jgi:hypothetical protein
MNIFNCPKKRRVSMKNLMNRVLVVLAISAVFAGSIDAVQKRTNSRRAPAKRTARARNARTTMSRGQAALNYLQYTAVSNFRVHTAERRKAQAAILTEEVPGATRAIAELLKAALITDDVKRAASLRSGAGMKAAATIKAIMMNDDLKEATEDLKANPTPENVAKVAEIQADATAAVVQLDEESQGDKGYMTKRNILMGTIAAATLAVTAYCIANGAPAFLAPYVPQVATDAANKIYNATSAAGEFLGMQEGGKLYGAAVTAKSYITPVTDKVWEYGPAQIAAKTKQAYNYFRPDVVKPQVVTATDGTPVEVTPGIQNAIDKEEQKQQ